MPNKNIYIRKEDLEIFEKAEKLGGDSISAIIAEALQKYVEIKEAELAGMQEQTLTVGIFRPRGEDDTRKIKFVGRLLAEGTVYTGQTSSRDDRGITYKVYQTKAGKIIIFWRKWSRWERENDYADYNIFDALPEHDDVIEGKVLDSYDHDFVKVPGSLLQEAAEALGQELVEYIE